MPLAAISGHILSLAGIWQLLHYYQLIGQNIYFAINIFFIRTEQYFLRQRWLFFFALYLRFSLLVFLLVIWRLYFLSSFSICYAGFRYHFQRFPFHALPSLHYLFTPSFTPLFIFSFFCIHYILFSHFLYFFHFSITESHIFRFIFITPSYFHFLRLLWPLPFSFLHLRHCISSTLPTPYFHYQSFHSSSLHISDFLHIIIFTLFADLHFALFISLRYIITFTIDNHSPLFSSAFRLLSPIFLCFSFHFDISPLIIYHYIYAAFHYYVFFAIFDIISSLRLSPFSGLSFSFHALFDILLPFLHFHCWLFSFDILFSRHFHSPLRFSLIFIFLSFSMLYFSYFSFLMAFDYLRFSFSFSSLSFSLPLRYYWFHYIIFAII